MARAAGGPSAYSAGVVGLGCAGGLTKGGDANAAPAKLEQSAAAGRKSERKSSSFMGVCLRAGRAGPVRETGEGLGGGGCLLGREEDLEKALRNQLAPGLKRDRIHAGFGQKHALHFQRKIRDACLVARQGLAVG